MRCADKHGVRGSLTFHQLMDIIFIKRSGLKLQKWALQISRLDAKQHRNDTRPIYNGTYFSHLVGNNRVS